MPANEYFDSSGVPSTSAAGTSATIRAEFDAVETGFNKLPAMASYPSKLVQVNSAGTALTAAETTISEAHRLTGTPVNTQTGTTYTLVLSDAGKMVTLSNAASIAVTVPTNASVAFATGARIDLAQLGAGSVAIAGDTGVTVNSKSAYATIGARYVAVTLIKTGTNTWLLCGDLVE